MRPANIGAVGTSFVNKLPAIASQSRVSFDSRMSCRYIWVIGHEDIALHTTQNSDLVTQAKKLAVCITGVIKHAQRWHEWASARNIFFGPVWSIGLCRCVDCVLWRPTYFRLRLGRGVDYRSFDNTLLCHDSDGGSHDSRTTQHLRRPRGVPP